MPSFLATAPETVAFIPSTVTSFKTKQFVTTAFLETVAIKPPTSAVSQAERSPVILPDAKECKTEPGKVAVKSAQYKLALPLVVKFKAVVEKQFAMPVPPLLLAPVKPPIYAVALPTVIACVP